MNELAVVESVTNIGGTIMSMVSMVKNFGIVNKKASIVLAEELRSLKYEARAKGIYHLIEMNLEHLDQTNRKIAQANHSGRVLEMDMELLELQYRMLHRDVERYANEKL